MLTCVSVARLAADPERASAGLCAREYCPPEGCACARVCPEERGCSEARFSLGLQAVAHPARRLNSAPSARVNFSQIREPLRASRPRGLIRAPYGSA